MVKAEIKVQVRRVQAAGGFAGKGVSKVEGQGQGVQGSGHLKGFTSKRNLKSAYP